MSETVTIERRAAVEHLLQNRDDMLVVCGLGHDTRRARSTRRVLDRTAVGKRATRARGTRRVLDRTAVGKRLSRRVGVRLPKRTRRCARASRGGCS